MRKSGKSTEQFIKITPNFWTVWKFDFVIHFKKKTFFFSFCFLVAPIKVYKKVIKFSFKRQNFFWVLVFSFMYLVLVDAMDWSIVTTYYLTNECMACIIKPIPDTSKTTKWHYENCQDTLRHSWARVVCLFPFIWLISYVKTCNKNVLFVNLICTYVIFIGDQSPNSK